ncbi:meiosis regulator and mRNA stability factor 1-like [Capsella rubella]|uniref:meiosis regulator and mRNA stability factor 1-like n=1 Tax=Capsella rubella TaxID=81985 RepID=UPI000CD5B915|nr:meiosis regulator and mRNA stability factor 1-like [Capsella rubella]
MVNNSVAEAAYEEAATSVWWDIENCPIPKGCKPEGIVEKIRSALNKLNYRGNISIFAYGNMDHIPPSVKQALSSTGITLNHVNSSSERGEVSMDIFNGVSIQGMGYNKKPPANIMFICRDYTNLMYFCSDERRQRGYNFLVAHPQHPSDSLVASVKTTWLWRSILEEPDL